MAPNREPFGYSLAYSLGLSFGKNLAACGNEEMDLVRVGAGPAPNIVDLLGSRKLSDSSLELELSTASRLTFGDWNVSALFNLLDVKID